MHVASLNHLDVPYSRPSSYHKYSRNCSNVLAIRRATYGCSCNHTFNHPFANAQTKHWKILHVDPVLTLWVVLHTDSIIF